MPKAHAQEAQETRANSRTGDATRNRILAAAARLVAERGWGSVTTRAVAERAGVNAALVHYHFGTMDALLREAVLARLAPEVEELAEPLLTDGSFADMLHRVVERLDRFDFESEPGILFAEVFLRATRDEILAAALGDEIRAWRTLLEPRLLAAVERGEIRRDVDPGTLAVIIAATLDGLLLQRMADPDTDPTAVATAVARLLAPVPEDGS